MQKAREMASAIQHTPLPLTGQLVKFALFRTRQDEYFLFGLGHHISVDGLGMALVESTDRHDLHGAGLGRAGAAGVLRRHCRISSTARRNTKHPRACRMIWRTGRTTFHPKAVSTRDRPSAENGRDAYAPSASVEADPGRRGSA